MDSLKGKVCVVTGASSGIGEATAIALSKKGANVVLAARREERLKQIIERMETECLTVMTDVTNRQDVEDLINKTYNHFGKVDVLINNAGILLPGNIDKFKVEEWEKMIDVNLKGVLYGVAAVLPLMKERNSGHIINVASRGAHRVRPGRSVYSATKFAVRALSDGLRQELSECLGVRVSIVSPGAVETEINNHFSKEEQDVFMKTREFSALSSEDVAEAILFTLQQPANVNVSEVIVMPSQQRI